MSTEPKDQRVPVMMSQSELKAIDDWSFEQRIRSRGEAIRRLIKMGLDTASKGAKKASK
jgi:metal-responsive CopG/Arc/MetJ family transcriptional regulator